MADPCGNCPSRRACSVACNLLLTSYGTPPPVGALPRVSGLAAVEERRVYQTSSQDLVQIVTIDRSIPNFDVSAAREEAASRRRAAIRKIGFVPSFAHKLINSVSFPSRRKK